MVTYEVLFDTGIQYKKRGYMSMWRYIDIRFGKQMAISEKYTRQFGL